MDKLKMLDWTTVLSTSAVITTVCQFLSGGLVCYKFMRNKSTGESSGFPFICGLLSCSLWLKYGLLTKESAVVLVNAVGSTLFFSYVIIYWTFTINKRATFKQLFLVILVLGTTITYADYYEANHAGAVSVIGYLCCAVTVIFFAAPCCMLMEVIRMRSTHMLPFPLIFTSFCVSIQWLIFGTIIGDPFLQIPNLLGALLSGTQLMLFIIYPSKTKAMANNEVPYSIF